MKKLLVLIVLYVLFCSHELFLKTDSYFIGTNESVELYLFNGTFDESENIITRDRIINAKIIGPDYKFYPANDDYYDRDKVTYLKFKSGNEGTYVAGISTLPRVIELSAVDFQEYLEHEELTDVIEMRETMGITDSSARERYSKHVKAILQVSDKQTSHFKTEFGYPIEFIPLQNPYELTLGDKISFRLLSGGKPLSDQIVHYSVRTVPDNKLHEENSTRTDKDGIITITLSEKGRWYVATIHMVEIEAKDIDYESNWATLTFEVR